MRVGKPSDDRIVINIKKASRNLSSGKLEYETMATLDVFDATTQQIEKILLDALKAKETKETK
jgi:hypothetical protein